VFDCYVIEGPESAAAAGAVAAGEAS